MNYFVAQKNTLNINIHSHLKRISFCLHCCCRLIVQSWMELLETNAAVIFTHETNSFAIINSSIFTMITVEELVSLWRRTD